MPDPTAASLRAFHQARRQPAAACLHLARTVCRRAERQVVLLAAQEPAAGSIVPYLNVWPMPCSSQPLCQQLGGAKTSYLT